MKPGMLVEINMTNDIGFACNFSYPTCLILSDTLMLFCNKIWSIPKTSEYYTMSYRQKC
jgi:hypothetical protein